MNSSKTQPFASRARRIRRRVICFFIGVFLFLIWRIYPLFSHIRPFVLGLPFSLFYLVAVLVFSFLVMLSFYLWEEHHGELE